LTNVSLKIGASLLYVAVDIATDGAHLSLKLPRRGEFLTRFFRMWICHERA
jgi:hypothetical protein